MSRNAMVALLFVLAASGLARGQDRVLSFREKGGQDVNLTAGKIIEESAARLVLQTASGAKQVIPADLIVEVTYDLPAKLVDARAAYRKAESLVQAAGQAGSEAQRQEMLTQAIAQFGMVLAEAKESKAVQRHMQFKIASLQAQRAGNDRDQAKQAAAALEKFLQDHADSWQSHFARKLLAELKKP